MFIEYPKSLYLKGWDDLDACVVVKNADEEDQARKDGYRALHEPVADVQDEPKKRGRPRKTESEQ